MNTPSAVAIAIIDRLWNMNCLPHNVDNPEAFKLHLAKVVDQVKDKTEANERRKRKRQKNKVSRTGRKHEKANKTQQGS
jgi:hypothetical protein